MSSGRRPATDRFAHLRGYTHNLLITQEGAHAVASNEKPLVTV